MKCVVDSANRKPRAVTRGEEEAAARHLSRGGIFRKIHTGRGLGGGLTLGSRLRNSFPFLREARVPTTHNLFPCVGASSIQINRVKQQCARPERAPGTGCGWSLEAKIASRTQARCRRESGTPSPGCGRPLPIGTKRATGLTHTARAIRPSRWGV